MAWNIPGSGGNGSGSGNGNGNGGRRDPWRPNGGGGRDGDGGWGGFPDRLKGMFDGGGNSGLLRWIGLALILLLVFSCFQLVGEQQRGVVLRFGQFARIMQPGPNFKLPWPIEQVTKVNATAIKNFSNTVPVLTRDENIVMVSMNVQYRVGDPQLYLFGTRSADRVLEQAAQSAVREQVGRSDLDTVLGARGPLSLSASQQLQASLDAYRTGLVVTELNLQDARPPEEVKPAFDEVNSAQQIKDQLVNEARAYAARVVPEARGEAARLRTGAEGYKSAKVARAEGDAIRFSLIEAEYRNAPEVTRKRLWLETVERVMADNRKVVGGDGRQLIYVPMPGQTGTGAATPPVVLPPEVVTPSQTTGGAGARAPERNPRSLGGQEGNR